MDYSSLKTKAAQELLLRLGGPDKYVQMRVIDVAMSQETIELLKQEVGAYQKNVATLEGRLRDIERVNHEIFAKMQSMREQSA